MATCLIALIAFGGAVSAETPTTVSPLTVHPPPAAAESLHQRFVQGLDFVTSHGAPARLGQLARWQEPVCPIAVGLTPAQDALVAERVKTLAASVGAPQARRPGRCKPNIEILFTDQPQSLLDLVAKKRGELLGFRYAAQEKAVRAMTAPIQAWYLTATVAGSGGSIDAPASIGSGSSLDLEFSHMPGGCAGSAFTDCLRSDFANILVVADANALSGRKIGAVADYIALISLAQFKAAKTCSAPPSLLDMFTPSCAGRGVADAPAGLDLGYLKALYRGGNALRLWLQKSLIAERMARSAP